MHASEFTKVDLSSADDYGIYPDATWVRLVCDSVDDTYLFKGTQELTTGVPFKRYYRMDPTPKLRKSNSIFEIIKN